jgi:hypothetical protein
MSARGPVSLPEIAAERDLVVEAHSAFASLGPAFATELASLAVEFGRLQGMAAALATQQPTDRAMPGMEGE